MAVGYGDRINWKALIFSLGVFLAGQLGHGSEAPPPLHLFALSPPTLAQPLPKKLESNSGVTSKPVSFSAARPEPEMATLLYIQRYEAMNGVRFMSAPATKADLGGFAGFLQKNVFDPVGSLESVKFKHVTLTGGIVGALKHGNPIYLINPLVFSIDW